MAYVPQRGEVAFAFTAREVVRLGRYAAGGGPGADEALAAVGLAERADEQYGELSAGQQQRVTVARALAQVWGRRESVILADEPVSAMDPAHALRTMDLLAAHARAGGTVVAVLHDLSLVLRYATGVVVLEEEGRVIARELTPAVLERAFGVGFRELRDGGAVAAFAAVNEPRA